MAPLVSPSRSKTYEDYGYGPAREHESKADARPTHGPWKVVESYRHGDPDRVGRARSFLVSIRGAALDWFLPSMTLPTSPLE